MVNIWLILMVIIWLMMVNNHLVGGWPTPLKNDGVRQWLADDIPVIQKKSAKAECFGTQPEFGDEIGKAPQKKGFSLKWYPQIIQMYIKTIL